MLNREPAHEKTHSVIGYVVGGGLKENLRVRLTVPAYQVQEGGFVVIESGEWLFYGLVTDLQLGATIGGTSDIYTLAVRTLSGTHSAIGSLSFWDLT